MEKPRKTMTMREMGVTWRRGREPMQTTDRGSRCKRMSLAFFARLIILFSTTRRLRSLSAKSTAARIQKGLIRYLYVIIDLSAAAGEMDYRPSRMVVVAKHVESFIREFFDQNPLSQIGLLTIKDGVAQCLTDLGGSPESHVKALMGKLGCSGASSLQNALDLVRENLEQIPSYGHREVLILYSALSTCDPGDIMDSIQKCKKSKIRCSVIGLSAEIFICKHLCQETGGSYSVALEEETKVGILLHAQIASSTSVLIVTFIFMRACTTARDARASGVPNRCAVKQLFMDSCSLFQPTNKEMSDNSFGSQWTRELYSLCNVYLLPYYVFFRSLPCFDLLFVAILKLIMK